MRISNRTTEYLRYCRVEKENRPTSIGTYRAALRKIVATIGNISFPNINQNTVLELKEKLVVLDLLDDLAFAAWWIDQRNTFRPKGKKLLVYELKQKGISGEIIQEAKKGFSHEAAEEIIKHQL